MFAMQSNKKNGSHSTNESNSVSSKNSVEKQITPIFLQKQTHHSQSMNDKHFSVQAKLNIGAPNDEYEQEADQVSDKVMRKSPSQVAAVDEVVEDELLVSNSVQRKSSTPIYLQRMCAECEQEQEDEPEIQAKADSGVVTATNSHLTHTVSNASGGSAVPDHVRARTESVLGRDLSHVRVHNDPVANQAAESINAKAFTHSHHIWLGSGQSADDVALMSHELTHTVQQGASNSAPGLQRLDQDFRVSGLSREGDASKIYFEEGGAAIPPSQYSKLSALASPATQNLTLFGYSSEEGPASGNTTLVDRRISGVSRALYRRGHRATRTRRPRVSDSTGQIDYRNMRSVQVLPTPAPVGGVSVDPTPSIDPCTGPAPLPDARCGTAIHPCTNSPANVESCGSSFTDAYAIAVPWVVTAVSKLLSTDAATVTQTNTLLGQLFPGISRSQVLTNVFSIMLQVINSAFQHRCHNECDGGCDRPAYNSGTGVGASGAVVTLCPGFINRGSATANARTLVHESTHGASGVSTRDLGYGSSRLIANMTGADALRNTDSYVLLIRSLHSPGSVTIGPSAANRDDVVGMSSSEESASRSAIAYMESWLNYASFDTSLIYSAVHRSVAPATQWSTQRNDQLFHFPKLHEISSLFSLTDPGAAAPFNNANLPQEQDKNKLAAIHDRYSRMYSSVDREKLTVTKGGASSEGWSADSAGFFLQNNFVVGPLFLTATLENKVLYLIRLMASGLPDVSGAYENAYATAANRIRKKRTLGP